jgi:predicted dinucleotide-binding enzyme
VAELPPPPEGIVLAHFIVSDDVERSRRFYTEVLGGRVAFSGPGGLTYVLPQGQSSGEAVAGWLPAGARLAMAFGSMSADLFESSGNRSPEPAVLFYVTDDDRAGEEVERLIRTAGFEPVKAGGIGQWGRLEVGGDLHDLVIGPAQARSLIGGA